MKNLSGKLIAGFCSAALAMTMTSFAAAADEEAALNSYEADSTTVKLLGRTERVKDSLWLTYTDSGVEFKCTGTQVKFNVSQSGADTRVQVYVNGKVAKRGVVSGDSAVISVDLEEGENTVKFIKLSESAQSVFAIDSIELDGEAPTPTESNTKKIEFIGDSITCGYGADGTLKNSFSTATENGSLTYAYQTARNFDADYSMVSVSGIGVVSGYTSNGVKNEASGAIMPPIYTSTGFSWYWLNGATPTNLEWDFDNFDTDLVVINLGTNDYNYTKSDSEKCAEFEDSYAQFLKTVREKNPNAEILCVLGLMGQNLYPNIENAVEAYKTDSGDEHIATFKLTQIDADDGYGVDYHPNATSHLKAAAELTEEIATLYGWATVEDTDEGDYDVTKEYTFTSDGESVVDVTPASAILPGNSDNETGEGDTDNGNGDGDSGDGENDGDDTEDNTDDNITEQDPTDDAEPSDDIDAAEEEPTDDEEPADSDDEEAGDDDSDSDTDEGDSTDDGDSSAGNAGAGSTAGAATSGADSTNGCSAASANGNAGASGANSGTATATANDNPNTGATEGLAALAILSGAIVVLKKR